MCDHKDKWRCNVCEEYFEYGETVMVKRPGNFKVTMRKMRVCRKCAELY